MDKQQIIEAYRQGFKDELIDAEHRDYDDGIVLSAYHIGRLYTLISGETLDTIDDLEEEEILEIVGYFERSN